MATDPAIALLLDRVAIADTLYRYGSCIDRGDGAGLRAVLADDVWARYGNGEPIVGGDALVAWIEESTRDALWQHHFLSVYHVDLDGDEARALVYHTSHRAIRDDPSTVTVLVGRYHDELRRVTGGWRISRLELEYVWAERRTDSSGYLDAIGGRGPLRGGETG